MKVRSGWVEARSAVSLVLRSALIIPVAAYAQSSIPASPSPAIPPVISQSQLDAALPPLTPEGWLSSSIGNPSVQPAEPGVTAPENDPELAKPLPPIEDFNPATLLHDSASDASPAAELRYSIRIEGPDHADSQIDANLARQFHALSALDEGKGRVVNEAMLAARLEEDSRLMQRLLFAQGWYDAHVATRIDRSENGKSPAVEAVISVAPGEQYRLGTITIAAAPTVPPDLIRKSLSLQPAELLIADKVQGAEANVALALPRNGYPFAELGKRDVLLDPDSHLADYTLPVEIGPRGRFGDIIATGDLAFDARHASVLARFRRGDLYDSGKVDDLQQALLATGLFASVSASPKRTGLKDRDGSEYVTIAIVEDAGPPRTIAGELGYGAGEGFLLKASWTHRNLFPPEGALILGVVAGTDAQSGSATLRRSNFRKRDRTLQIALEAKRSRYDAYNALTGQLSVRMSYDSTPLWQKPLTWALGSEILGTVEEDYDSSLGRNNKRQFLIGALSGQIGIDETDSLLDPTRGFRVGLLLQPEAALRQGLHPYVRSQIDASAYQTLAKGIVAAARVRVGSIVGTDRFSLAPSRRYYAGGGGSVRGYTFQGLGPKGPLGEPLGGLSLFEASGELRWRLGDFGLAGFVDAGQTYESRLPAFSGIRAGAGLGLRYYTDFGPIRLDVATPLARRSGESRFNLYISIGQAF